MTRKDFEAALQEGIAETIKKNIPLLVDALNSMSTPTAAEAHVREVMGRIFRIHALITAEIETNIKD